MTLEQVFDIVRHGYTRSEAGCKRAFKSWKEVPFSWTVSRIILSRPERSCFITAMRESPFSGAVFLWPAYRVGQNVYLQHRLILPEHVNGSFDPSDPYAQIDHREPLS